MQNITIGKSGIEVPFLGMGTWAIGGGSWWGDNDDALSVNAIEAAVEQGIRWIDTAPIYGLYHSEQVVGEACGASLLGLRTACGSGRLLRFEVERLEHGVVGSSTISGSVGAFPPTQVLVTTQLHRHLCAVGKCDNLLQLLSRNGVGCGAECEEH